MAILNQTQSAALRQYYDALAAALNDDSQDALCFAMCTQLQGLGFSEARSVCQQIDAGFSRTRTFLDSEEFRSAGSVRDVLDAVTRDMTSQERKGYCMFVYEALRNSDAKRYPEAKNAQHAHQLVPAHDENDLMDIVAAQVELHAALIMESVAESAEDTDWDPNPELLAAALYVASAKGSLPSYFAAAPELLGLCCATGERLKIIEIPTDTTGAKMLAFISAAVLTLFIYMIIDPVIPGASESLFSALMGDSFAVLSQEFIATVIHYVRVVGYSLVYKCSFDSAVKDLGIYERLTTDELPLRSTVKETARKYAESQDLPEDA